MPEDFTQPQSARGYADWNPADLQRRVGEVARGIVEDGAQGDADDQAAARLIAQGVWVVGMSVIGIADALQTIARSSGT